MKAILAVVVYLAFVVALAIVQALPTRREGAGDYDDDL